MPSTSGERTHFGKQFMIRKVVKKGNLREFSEITDNLAYWLSKHLKSGCRPSSN